MSEISRKISQDTNPFLFPPNFRRIFIEISQDFLWALIFWLNMSAKNQKIVNSPVQVKFFFFYFFFCEKKSEVSLLSSGVIFHRCTAYVEFYASQMPLYMRLWGVFAALLQQKQKKFILYQSVFIYAFICCGSAHKTSLMRHSRKIDIESNWDRQIISLLFVAAAPQLPLYMRLCRNKDRKNSFRYNSNTK